MKNRITLLLITMLAALSMAGNDDMPADPELRLGTLPCGTTYYIRHNANPAGRAEMWMVLRAGSVVEKSDEVGYAHLLEHMAFTGTTHFPGIAMVNYFTTHGMSYGTDINASTSYDDVRFQLSNVPTDRWQVVDSALLALSDLSCGLTLNPDDIEHEKAIVEEEWRTRNDFGMRMIDVVMPQLLGDNPYATHNPIGTMSVLRLADHDSVSRFYHRWFRPELQAVVIVGDFDVDAMEQHLRQAFADMARPSTVCPDPTVTFSLRQGLRYGEFADADASATTFHIYFPEYDTNARRPASFDELRSSILCSLVTQIVDERLKSRTLTADTHLLSSNCSYDHYLMLVGSDAVTINAVADGDAAPALNETLTMVHSIVEHGFTASELKRAKASFKVLLENARAELANTESKDYVDEYISHFLYGSYITSRDVELDAMLQMLDTVSLATVDRHARKLLDPAAMTIFVTSSNADNLPGRAHTEAIVADAWATTTAPPDDETRHNGDQLLDHNPTPGRIVSETTGNDGVTTMRLSNGITLLVMPTTWKSDEVLFGATSPGGISACDRQHDTEVRLVDDVVEKSALGRMSQDELVKHLAGSSVGLIYTMGECDDNIIGECRPSDLATLLQVNYLYFTAVSPDSAAWRTLKRQLTTMTREAQGKTETIFADSVASTLYHHRPLFMSLTEDDITHADFADVLALYHEHTRRPQDYTFSIVGNIDLASLRPLVELYLASLPVGTGKPPTADKQRIDFATGDVDNVFLTPMATPKASIYANLMGHMEYNMRNEMLIGITGQVLGSYLNSYLREELKATYGVTAEGSLERDSGKWMLTIRLDCQPEITQDIIREVAVMVDVLLSRGCDDTLLGKIRDQMLVEHDIESRTNEYWLGVLHDRALGYDSHTGYRALLESITTAELNAFIDSLDPTTRLRVVMQGYPKF